MNLVLQRIIYLASVLGYWNILVFLSFCIAYRLLRNKYQHGLVGIPGPTLAAYSKLWRVCDVYQGNAHQTAINLHRKHGTLVRVAPNVISVSDISAIPVIYSIKEDFTKSAFYPIQSITWKKRIEENLFSTRNPEHHRIEKRKVGATFSANRILESEIAIDSCIELCMKHLQDFASSQRPVNLREWIQYCAFDVIGEITFARKFGFLEQGKDVDGMIDNIRTIVPYSAICGQVPEYHKYLLGNPLLSKVIPPMETWDRTLLFTLKSINTRASLVRDGELINTDVEGHDQLSRWAYVKSSEPHKMDTRDIVVHASANVFAGSDTVTIAETAVVNSILQHPECMSRLVAEMAKADRAGLLSNPVQYKEAMSHLPYLQAVVKEGMRLHPSLGLLFERHVPREGAIVSGRFIPGGTIVGINPWVTNRDETLFSEPDAFKPERWLEEASTSQLQAMNDTWEFTFGGGSRKCIGRHIAMIEIHKFIPEFFRRFKVELKHPERKLDTLNRWFVHQSELICNLSTR